MCPYASSDCCELVVAFVGVDLSGESLSWGVVTVMVVDPGCESCGFP